MSESPHWNVAARFMTTGEAEAAASALDAAGIECEVADENLISVNWEMAQAIGGVKILVRDEDVERATEIISMPAVEQTIEPVIPPMEVEQPAVCPQCGSPDYQLVPRFRLFLLIAAVFVGIGVAVDQTLLAATGLVAVAVGVMLMPSARCTRCLHRWTPPPSREQDVEAPPPQPVDMVEERCPRCGSFEVYRINDRRLKTWPLLFSPSIFAVLPIWLFSHKRQCESCGLKLP